LVAAQLLCKLSDMSKIKIKLIKSPIDKSKRQKSTLTALGFRKVNQVVEHEATPQIQGMIRVVDHLVQVENA
jgi:large subunit ribosomal protein L30